MRCFIAIELPEAVKSDIARRVAELRGQFPPARWVPRANYHLTLLFLGELAASRAERLGARLAPVFENSSRLTLALRGGGRFPPTGRARVVWLGFEPDPELERLSARIARHSAEWMDRPPDTRPFRPHLTIARCRKPWPAQIAEQLVDRLREFPSQAIDVRRAALMESGGGRYRVVSGFPLGTSA